MVLNAIISPKVKALFIPVTSLHFPNLSFSCMIDCGSSHCFIDSHFAKVNHFPVVSVPRMRLRLIDGSSPSYITRATDISVQFPCGTTHQVRFLITKLDTEFPAVLGLDWLTLHNPLINWADSCVTFRDHPDSSPATTHSVLANQEELSSDDDTTSELFEDLPDPNPDIIPEPTPEFISDPSPTTSESCNRETGPAPFISLVSAEAFLRSMQTEGAECFSVLAHEPIKSDPPDKPKFNPDLEQVPNIYHEFADVFSKKKADTLPPHRDCDLHINIEEGAKPPSGTIYPLSAFELNALREFIDENLKSGFIRPSNSPFGAPVLFVKKKDGSLRLCVDFRRLNAITRKDKYPLPLTSELLDTPSRAKIFTKIDLKHAYHLIRIAAGDEWKTAFRTKYGSFEWLVMPFGLTNAPGGFQRFLNGIFNDLLDVYVIIYLDDILIFSGNKDEHFRHVSEVLKRLRKHGLYANGKKCSFHTESVDYLGHMIGPDGLQMDPAKIKVIQDWPEPRKVKDIQSFLGFANFYRRYIHNYSDIVVPLTRLTRKNIPWNFDEKCKLAFLTLKQAFITAPVLTHYKPGCPLVIETDASDYALAAILSQVEPNGEIHPITFLSQTFTDTELNYDTHDKELMAIFEAFKAWRHYLEGTDVPIDVVTDHKNLEYFCTTRILSRRQARWSTFLSSFNMVIRFRPGRLGTKPDALTRRPDLYPKGEGKPYGTVNPQNCRPVFSSSQLSASLRATNMLPVVLRGVVAMDFEELQKDILSAYDTDPAVQTFRADPDNPKYSRWSEDDAGFVRIDQRILVPESGDLRLRVLQSFHDHPVSGHYGINKTLAVIRREYTWPNIRDFVANYVLSCTTCARSKPRRHKPYGLLRQLPIPLRPWESISMDFIEQLPDSGGFTAILVVVDRFSKQSIFIPTHDTINSAQLAELFIIHVFSKHGVPSHVTSDRGSEFVSRFFRSLGKALNMKLHFTSGYHPEGDGQTERVNQTLEQYLRVYCNYQHDNWHSLLPIAEFCYNNTPSSTTGVSPFFANKGYNPAITIHSEYELTSLKAQDFVTDLQELHDQLRITIRESQDRIQQFADKNRIPPPEFKIGDKAFVKAKFFRTTRPSKKLSEKYLGPYDIISQVGPLSWTLRLPDSMRAVHPVFHVSMLEPSTPNTIPNRVQPPPPPITVDEELEYEISEILDSKLDKRRACKLLYLVRWSGYEGTDDETSWIPANELGHATEVVSEFHLRYPNKPGPL